MNNFKELLLNNPIIGAVRNDSDLNALLDSSVQLCFVLYGSILNIGSISEKLTNSGKTFLIHLDMLDGLKPDESGISFIKNTARPYGIISTRPSQIKLAKNASLRTILRIFIIDSKSFETGIHNIDEYKPDVVEVMPGISDKIIRSTAGRVKIPVIAGGLIETKEDVLRSLKAGAISVSTTKREIWDI